MIYTTHLLSFTLLFIPVVLANDLILPVQTQLPLIARINEPYTWSISPRTFSDSSAVTASHLPQWLSFSNNTFTGIPTPADEGNPVIILSAGDASDKVTLCVTPFPPPVARLSFADQFNTGNPSFSSVFPLHRNSALATDVPAVRVPLNWSFSVGFEGGTFAPASPDKSSDDGRFGSSNLFYAALQADGSPLPSWITFDPHTITFNGVTHAPPVFDPDRLPVVLIASDQQGYSAVRAPFDIVVASHELSYAGPSSDFPVNVTLGEVFQYNFVGDDSIPGPFILDNRSIQATDISGLSVDTTGYPWLSYDANSMSLRGTPPTSALNRPVSLPMTLRASNQSISINLALNTGPSYFNTANMKSVFVAPGSALAISLAEYTTEDKSGATHAVNLTATFNPSVAGSYLHLVDQDSHWSLIGTVPSDASYSRVNITVTAQDQTTHASSHLMGLVELRAGISGDTVGNLAKHRKVALALGIAFGVIGGVVTLFGFLACCRKFCAVKDTAMDPYANEKAYGLDPDQGGYGWSEKLGLGLGLTGKATSEVSTAVGGTMFDRVLSPALPKNSGYATNTPHSYRSPFLGVGLGAAPEQTGRSVKKSAFFEGVKSTFRQFSGSISRSNRQKAAISKPILMFTKDSAESVNSSAGAGTASGRLTNLSNMAQSNVALAGSYRSVDNIDGDGVSLGLNSSPSSSTRHTGKSGGSTKSVPRQRPDFGPPGVTMETTSETTSTALVGQRQQVFSPVNHPAQAHVTKQKSRPRSADSGSLEGEVEEAVITTASRAPSVRSAHSSLSYAPSAQDSSARPRLVQFTSARGVPVPIPNLPTTNNTRHDGADERRVSHVARVYGEGGAAASPDGQDPLLTEGMRYVKAFGNHNEDLEPKYPPNLSSPSIQSKRSRPVSVGTNKASLSPAPTSSMRSHSPIPTQTSYMYPSPSASFDSALDGGAATTMSRILIGTGEAFAFKFPVAATPGTQTSNRQLTATLLHGGRKLPPFLSYAYVPCGKGSKREEVEFWGTPDVKDIGEVMIGIFDQKNECIGRLVVEVVGRG